MKYGVRSGLLENQKVSIKGFDYSITKRSRIHKDDVVSLTNQEILSLVKITQKSRKVEFRIIFPSKVRSFCFYREILLNNQEISNFTSLFLPTLRTFLVFFEEYREQNSYPHLSI